MLVSFSINCPISSTTARAELNAVQDFNTLSPNFRDKNETAKFPEFMDFCSFVLAWKGLIWYHDVCSMFPALNGVSQLLKHTYGAVRECRKHQAMLHRLSETTEGPSELGKHSLSHSFTFPGVDTALLERLWQSVTLMDEDQMKLVMGTSWLPYGLLNVSGVRGSSKTATVLTLISIMQAVEVDISNLAEHITSLHTKPESDGSEPTSSKTNTTEATSPKYMQPVRVSVPRPMHSVTSPPATMQLSCRNLASRERSAA